MINHGWNFENTYVNLPEIFFRHQKPEAFPLPSTVIFNHSLAKDLGLSPELENMPEFFAGTQLPPGAEPISQAYAGYQFGHFNMLGDGRAVLLGEQTTPDGRRFDIQLKGCGPTPFSRNGDGYAALLPMLREYIISEAMHFLGIPTTRSLAVVLTGEHIMRDAPKPYLKNSILPGAVLTRVASSHIRVGTFDYISRFGTPGDVQTLADYTIARHFPGIENADEKYLLFLRQAARRQAALIADWQLIGFIHGVMNTDNMSICGETIDYGPCAFMDTFDPSTVFSSIDTAGRYAYKNQPGIGAWNLSCFAESLLPLIHENENEAIKLAQDEIKIYSENVREIWLSGMQKKSGEENPSEFLKYMAENKLDYTTALREKNSNNPATIPRNHHVEAALSAAADGDFSVMQKLLSALSKPYEESEFSEPPKKPSEKYKTFCGT
ncbi:MAG: YdiU family protein [Defluviitaleaceae bacterium]|nr:YdiU family protein [Defluviitaleaceae bacterium]